MSRLYVISASTRPTSSGRPLARWVAGLAAAHDEYDVTLIDLHELALPFHDEPEHPSSARYLHQHTKDWSTAVTAADAFVFVMPMYNGGFGAALKNALDFLYNEWEGKPVGLISYSDGTSGGAPAIAMLTPVLIRLSLRPTATSVSIPDIDGHLAEDGAFRPDDELTKNVETVLGEVAALLTAPQPASA